MRRHQRGGLAASAEKSSDTHRCGVGRRRADGFARVLQHAGNLLPQQLIDGVMYVADAPFVSHQVRSMSQGK
jgi:hypothetical protein